MEGWLIELLLSAKRSEAQRSIQLICVKHQQRKKTENALSTSYILNCNEAPHILNMSHVSQMVLLDVRPELKKCFMHRLKD